MKDEALRLALEALGHFEKAGLATLKTIDAITAIKQAMEQPEPEPVAIIASLMPAERHTLLEEGHSLHDSLYTYPPKREPLTDDEFISMVDSAGIVVDPIVAFEIKEMVEAAHGIKGEA